MLSLSTLHTTLAHILAPPYLHTAILFTTTGQLISYASHHNHSSISPFTLNPPSASPQSDTDADTNVITVRTPGVAVGEKRAVARGSRSKDDIRVLVGLGSELWGETKGAGVGMVDSELGRIVVVPILALPSAFPSPTSTDARATPTDVSSADKDPAGDNDNDAEKKDKPDAPLMLIALNGTDDVSWDEMRAKANTLAAHLALPLSKYREFLVVAHPPLPLTGGVVPPGGGSSVVGVTSPAPGLTLGLENDAGGTGRERHVGGALAVEGSDASGATDLPSLSGSFQVGGTTPSSTAIIPSSATASAPHLLLDIPAGNVGVGGLPEIPTLPTRAGVQAYVTDRLRDLFTALIARIRMMRRWVYVGVFGMLNASSPVRYPRTRLGTRGRSRLSVEELERVAWDLEVYVDGMEFLATAASSEDEDEDENEDEDVSENRGGAHGMNLKLKDYCIYAVLECMVFLERVVPAIYTSIQAHVPHLAPTLALGTLSTHALAAAGLAETVAGVTGYGVLGGIGRALDAFVVPAARSTGLSSCAVKSAPSSPSHSSPGPDSSPTPTTSSVTSPGLSPLQPHPQLSRSASETSTLLGSPQISRSSTKTDVATLLGRTASTSETTLYADNEYDADVPKYGYGSTSSSVYGSQATFAGVRAPRSADREVEGREEVEEVNEAEEREGEEVEEEEAGVWCLRAVLIMAFVLPPIMALWLAPNKLLKLLSSVGALRDRHLGNEIEGFVFMKGREEEGEMDQVIRLASMYLRVAALGLPAFGVIEVLKRYLDAKGYSWVHPAVMTALNPLVVGLNYLLVAGPFPRLRLGFAAAPAVTAATHTALAAGMVACAGYLCLCSSATTEMGMKERRVGVGMKKGVERVDGSGRGEEERPLLPGSKQRPDYASRSNSSSKPYTIRSAMTRLGPSTLAAQSVLLATVATTHLVPAAARDVWVVRLKKHIKDNNIRRACVVALVGLAFTVLSVFFMSTAVIVFSSSIAQLVSPDEGVVRIATRAFPTIAAYIAAQGIGTWVDGGLSAFGYPASLELILPLPY
ncbi:hypothetical protein EYR38_000297 [Pleurotus pulmonarius]|nr:hypothetical protein EYR38_000297 [Pleurotus pulmonarius]